MTPRVIELDESFGDGLAHDAMIVIESLPEMMGGSPERAREHFERAVELTEGTSAGTFVTLAESVYIPTQDRAGFHQALEHALSIDPDLHPQRRLANLLAHERARFLLENADEWFLEPLEPE